MKSFIRPTQTQYRILGATFWIVCIQYFIVQLVVGLSWTNPSYSIANNTISDLANTVCGPYNGRIVCSPQYASMNASFITLGITMALGAAVFSMVYSRLRVVLLGFIMIAIGGIGSIIVGLFPENTISFFHVLGATLTFLIANSGILILGFTLPIHKIMKIYAVITGLVTLTALGLFFTHTYLGIGSGGMERIVGYPQTLWLIIFGLYMVRRRSQILVR